MRNIDISNQKFSDLTALKVVGRHSQRREDIYRCLCKCGKHIDVAKSELKNGHVKSCGTHKSRLSCEESVYRDAFRAYVFVSKRKHKETFDFSYEEFKTLILAPCHYCGVERYSKRLPLRASGVLGHQDYHVGLNGIDRINSKLGYKKNNVVTCCGFCNMAKSNHSSAEFIAWAKRLAEHQGWKSND